MLESQGANAKWTSYVNDGEEITPESATYAQAQKAYAVAYQQYMLESQGANAKWTSYVNELFGEADVELFGLYA